MGGVGARSAQFCVLISLKPLDSEYHHVGIMFFLIHFLSISAISACLSPSTFVLTKSLFLSLIRSQQHSTLFIQSRSVFSVLKPINHHFLYTHSHVNLFDLIHVFLCSCLIYIESNAFVKSAIFEQLFSFFCSCFFSFCSCFSSF